MYNSQRMTHRLHMVMISNGEVDRCCFFSDLDSSNLISYNCPQTWSSNDDNSNASLTNSKATRRGTSSITPNAPKRPVGRPPKKLQQAKTDEIIIQPSESNSLIEPSSFVTPQISFSSSISIQNFSS